MKQALAAALLAFALALPGMAAADNGYPYPGTQVIATKHSFDALWSRLKKAVKANKMGIVAQASASYGASRRGVKIAGNGVIGVYRNDFAVRMLKASVAAGIEAPLRFYVTENGDGTATLTYRLPSAVFKPYASADLDVMAGELDAIFRRIATQATE